MKNTAMVCSYRSSCIELPVALVGCQMEGIPLLLDHVCQVDYVVLNYIDFEGAERNICHDCVDELRGRGKPETLKKVGDRTVYRAYKSEEDEEEVYGKVLGVGSDEVSVMTVFTHVGQ